MEMTLVLMTLIICICIVLCVYIYCCGENGVFEYLGQEKRIRKLENELKRMKGEK